MARAIVPNRSSKRGPMGEVAVQGRHRSSRFLPLAVMLLAVILPSGRASLVYAMKVYRHRTRPANAAYQPVLAWPGGAMTDLSVSRWVDRLSTR